MKDHLRKRIRHHVKRVKREWAEHREKIKVFLTNNREYLDKIENTKLHNTQEHPNYRWFRFNIEELNIQLRWAEKTNKDGTITIEKLNIYKWKRNV